MGRVILFKDLFMSIHSHFAFKPQFGSRTVYVHPQAEAIERKRQMRLLAEALLAAIEGGSVPSEAVILAQHLTNQRTTFAGNSNHRWIG